VACALSAPVRAAAGPVPADVIARVKAARAAGRPAVVVLGLDGTLLDPAARTRDILTRALEGPGTVVTPEQPALAEQVQSLPLARYDFAPESTLARAGIVDTAMVRALTVRWTQDFYSNRFLLDDEALPGAVRYVDTLYAAGATLVYFTPRDAAHMLGGTAQGLLERGFPVGLARTQLVMRPDRRTDDLAWARATLDAIAATGDVVAVFDNEPRVVNLLHERFPKALAFVLTTPHSAGAPAVAAGVVPLPDFADDRP
jgi:hypothetical protein